MAQKYQVVIIGGGAAGFFFAANAAKLYPDTRFTILEMGRTVLGKVLVSGGGRCNVTHACFDPVDLVEYYPRGQKELLGAFYHFGPQQMIDWLAERKVDVKTEADGRIFPVSNRSETIAACLKNNAEKLGTTVVTGCKVTEIIPPTASKEQFVIKTIDEEIYRADKVFIGTGSSNSTWEMLEQMGHTIVPPVPSLFTFKTKDTRLRNLSGITLPNVTVKIPGTELQTDGPLLITHWGMSGPAILKMSAWGAKELNNLDYKFPMTIDWMPEVSENEILNWKVVFSKKQVSNHTAIGFPKRLWQNFLLHLKMDPTKKWADLNKQEWLNLVDLIKRSEWTIHGKTPFKEEFVTSGGVELKEVDFSKFESKIIPNLFFAGEVLNIDALTGGFNFQAAWTGAYVAADGLF